VQTRTTRPNFGYRGLQPVLGFGFNGFGLYGYGSGYTGSGIRFRVLCLVLDSAALTGLTFNPHQSDRSDQSTQNANWTSPLRRSRRDDQNAYVERPVQSPDEGVVVLARTSLAPDRSDWWDPTVLPVLIAKSELGVVSRCEIGIGFDSYWGKTSPAYIYEGSQPMEGDTIVSIN
jgi:hypothetical protein